MKKILFSDHNILEYGAAWNEQKQYFDKVASGEIENGVLMFVEHPHVYTLGKSGAVSNLLIDDAFLKTIDATYYKTDRGGDITYHGYGQIVGYPILNLEKLEISLRDYIFLVEQVIINTLKHFDILGSRLDGATGVWIEGQRKICAIGVKASRYITMHGFALNVTTDLNYFNHINPCGFVDKGVTSIKAELLRNDVSQTDAIDDSSLWENVKNVLKTEFEFAFGVELSGR